MARTASAAGPTTNNSPFFALRHPLQHLRASSRARPAVATTAAAVAAAGAGIATMPSAEVQLIKVPAKGLFTSEPDPRMFGNSANPKPSPSHWTNINWLKSRFHFSFAEYRDFSNQNFGALRVMNDDLVQPSRGFGAHGHQNAEICTYVVDGELTHADSMGTSETLQRGAIQFMSAGSGVRHSEFNNNPDAPLRFIQMWITPAKMNLKPNYGSASFDEKDRRNTWLHMVSDCRNAAVKTPVEIFQDINMYATEMDAGVQLPLALKAGRQAYALCIEGDGVAVVTAGSSREELCTHDAAKIINPSDSHDAEITVQAPSNSGAHILVVEMKR